ncbi:MAG: hypothetical protein Q8L48_20675 [Archangium sp.]|nr:hypothetical protein [Archangium sp.]
MRALMLFVVVASSSVMVGCGKPACSAATCATGCCDMTGVCQTGTQSLSCGIAGGACDLCRLGESCVQGTCFGGTSGGGAGGGTGGGAGGGVGIRLMPASATVPYNSQVELSAELTGGAPDQQINWSLESGSGRLLPTGPSSATYFAYSNTATVRIRAWANFLSSVATFADFAVSSSARSFSVVPQPLSSSPYILALGSPQTFGAVRLTLSPTSSYEGLRGVEWTVWPSGSITDGTATITSAMKRIYAREQSSNVWASVGVSGQTTTEPSVEITPALSTVAPNGVVQFTANISTGSAAQWIAATTNGGTISTSGTYTAPPTPGVYVIAAQASDGTGLRYAVATVIVQ